MPVKLDVSVSRSKTDEEDCDDDPPLSLLEEWCPLPLLLCEVVVVESVGCDDDAELRFADPPPTPVLKWYPLPPPYPLRTLSRRLEALSLARVL